MLQLAAVTIIQKINKISSRHSYLLSLQYKTKSLLPFTFYMEHSANIFRNLRGISIKKLFIMIWNDSIEWVRNKGKSCQLQQFVNFFLSFRTCGILERFVFLDWSRWSLLNTFYFFFVVGDFYWSGSWN